MSRAARTYLYLCIVAYILEFRSGTFVCKRVQHVHVIDKTQVVQMGIHGQRHETHI